MLGDSISDPEGTEAKGSMAGLGLLPVTTRLQCKKVRRQVQGKVNAVGGVFSAMSGGCFEGYEIHMGQTEETKNRQALTGPIVTGDIKEVYGTYIHGIFDRGVVAFALVNALAKKKGVVFEQGVCRDYKEFKETQYNKLADTLSEYLNMEEIYGMLGEAHIRLPIEIPKTL